MMLGRRRSTAVAVSAFLLGTAACYESDQPLSRPGQVALDSALLGEWRCEPAPPEPGQSAELSVFQFGETSYYAEWREDGNVDRYRVYASAVGDRVLLNVQELRDDAASSYVFLRYSIESDDRLRFSIVSQDALNGLTGAAALEAIRRRVQDETLYESTTLCTRGVPSPTPGRVSSEAVREHIAGVTVPTGTPPLPSAGPG